MHEITTDQQPQQQIEAMLATALAPFAEARAMLEPAPWNGAPCHKRRPDSPMRAIAFGPHGEGDRYLILEDVRRVDILVVLWLS